MKIKYIVVAVAIFAVIAFAAVEVLQKPATGPESSKNPQQTVTASSMKDENAPSIPQDKKALVVYFSYTGNTRILAEQIRQTVDGDILELQPATIDFILVASYAILSLGG